jgi:hypothetical protein
MSAQSKQWRLLNADEVTRPGDEYLDVNRSWSPCSTLGFVRSSTCRRRITDADDQADFQEAMSLIREMVNWSHTSGSADDSLESRARRFLERIDGGPWTGRKLQEAFCAARGVASNWSDDNSIDRAAWVTLAAKINQAMKG